MSLLSRFLDIGRSGGDEPKWPESVREIARRLEGRGPERARFLAAFAYVLARVAHADLRVDPAEIAEMERSVGGLGGLDDEDARLVVEIAVTQAADLGGSDDYLVTREFRRISDRKERVRLMRCLFSLAAADDSISTAETNELSLIGEELGFARNETNSLRSEWRDKLAELRKLPKG